MTATKTTLKKGDNLPARGRAFKTILLDAIREESLLGLDKKSSRDDASRAFIKHVAKRAFDAGDKDSAMLLKEFLHKSYPGLKSTLDRFTFNFPSDGSDVDKANAVLLAVSCGDLPPDVGQLLVGIIKDGSIIEANTDLKERISAIELSLGLSN